MASESQTLEEICGPSRDRRLTILQELYNGSITTPEAGDQLMSISIADDNLGLTSNLLLKAAIAQPEQHEKLVNVLLHVVQHPHPTGINDQTTNTMDTRLRNALPTLGMDLNTTWNSLTIPLSTPSTRQKALQRFLNTNILCAKLMTTHLPHFNYSTFNL